MKKQSLAIATVGMALASSLCAQSLFDLAPDDTETDSLPLRYTAGVNFGYDDNPTPLLGNEDESFYGQAYVGATFLNNSPQTTLSFGAQIGVIHYFDNLDVRGQNVDDTAFTASLYLNWTRRVSERLRFVSRNNVAYELEPDFSTGFQAQRQVGNYFRWSTDNAVGYRWSDRLATYTGIRLDGISFDDFDGGDRSTVTYYNDFRYQVSERTVATLTYRYSDVSADGAVTDSTNQFILAGLEHRFNQRSTGVIRAGVQLRDVDGGDSSSNPYVEGSFRTAINSQLNLRSYVRYGVEDFQRNVLDPSTGVNAFYSDTQTLRVGVTADYSVSQDLTLTGGINYAALSYEDLQAATGPGPAASSLDEELLNVFVGVNLRVTDNVSVNARYNFEDLTSDGGRDYDRNRFSIGASTQF
jgi:hypothetical protein